MVVLIVLVIILVIALIFIVKYLVFSKMLIDKFRNCNVIVGGVKGAGKDLLNQYVINKRKEPYYSNIDYGGKYHHVELKDIGVGNNTYENIINGNINKLDHMFIEGADIYISDIGIFLPSYMDSKLYRQFPSMPIFYALSRHLYNSNVHCNSQNIERGWKAIREQADSYILVLNTINIFGFLITKLRIYDRYDSAIKKLSSMKKRFNKFSKAEADKLEAMYGNIQYGYIIQHKSKIHYDTRAFEGMLLKGDRLYE